MATKDKADKPGEKSPAGTTGVSQKQVRGGEGKDPNNFANDKEPASAGGKTGGHSSK